MFYNQQPAANCPLTTFRFVSAGYVGASQLLFMKTEVFKLSFAENRVASYGESGM